MKTYLILLVLVGGMGLGGYAFAEHHDHADHDAKAHETMGETTNVGNTICPVSGDKIGSMGEAGKVEHEGKLYNLCCPACEKKFKEDPAKYIGIVDKELKDLEEASSTEGAPEHSDEHGHDHKEHDDHDGHKHK